MPAFEAPDNANLLIQAQSLQSEALLTELGQWRELLARRLMEDKYTITEPDLNRTVLTTILRILVFKIGEERGLVKPGTLKRMCEVDHIHEHLRGLDGDDGVRALASVFHEGETGRPLPVIDDDTLRGIIGRTASYEFPSPLSAIPTSDLAEMFERYLGSKMRIAEGYRVKRDEKSAVRDAGGVHITPQPVVEYMVRETIGRLVTGKTPHDVAGLRILDPACGAGTFLLSVYRYLLDWHLEWYRQNLVSVFAGNETITTAAIHMLATSLPVPDRDRESGEPDLPVRYGGTGDPKDPAAWTLTFAENQRILRTAIAGTDIDPEAAGVARFLLLLELTGDYTPASGDNQSLPDFCRTVGMLHDRIRCGNALIGSDYFSFRQEHPFNVDERRRVNAFDWQAEFPEIIGNGGFDAVIGAPPSYRPFSIKSRDEYFQMHYAAYAKTAGLYGYFTERGLNLLKPGGVLSLIVPDTFLRAHHARPLRRLLLAHQIEEIAEFKESRIVQAAETRICILILTKKEPDHAFRVSQAESYGSAGVEDYVIDLRFTVDQHSLGDGGWTLEDRRVEDLIEKLRRTGTPLKDYVMGQIERGIHHIKNNPAVIDAAARTRFIKKDWRCKKFFRPLLRPADIRRYSPEKPDRFLITAKKPREIKRCRALWKYLQSATALPPEPAGDGTGAAHIVGIEGPVIGEVSPSHNMPVPFPKIPKIVFAPVQGLPAFSYDPAGSLATTRMLWVIPRKDPVLVAVLNSTLGRFIIMHICPHGDRGYHLAPEHLGKFPVYTTDFDNPADAARHERLLALVTKMLELQKQLLPAKMDQERLLVQQEIDMTDKQIDALIYNLYGLTAEESGVIGESIEKN